MVNYNNVKVQLEHSGLFIDILLVLTVISTSFPTVLSYMITVEAGTENECFHESVPVGVKLGFSFEVIDGGFYDINVEIKDPNDVILYQHERASEGKFTVEANLEGPFHFCFNNRRVSYAQKHIIFDIDRSDQVGRRDKINDKDDPDEETTKLMSMVDNLLMATVSSRHDVRYLSARDRIHRRINDATNSKVVLWSGIEFILLLSVTIGQVWYLKRFFEIRRKA